MSFLLWAAGVYLVSKNSPNLYTRPAVRSSPPNNFFFTNGYDANNKDNLNPTYNCQVVVKNKAYDGIVQTAGQFRDRHKLSDDDVKDMPPIVCDCLNTQRSWEVSDCQYCMAPITKESNVAVSSVDGNAYCPWAAFNVT